MKAPSIALVSAVAARGLDDDEAPLRDALVRAGAAVDVMAWDDPDVEWGRFDLALIRSTWDYATRRDEFLEWAGRAATLTSLQHPPAVLRWNTDKRYLAELAGLGSRVVPTAFVEPDTTIPLDLPLDGEVVLKPAVGAGSRLAARCPGLDDPRTASHLARIHAEGITAMVQPYRARVDDEGEAAIVFFDGERSHAITKGPILLADGTVSESLFAPEQISRREPSDDEIEVATQVVVGLAQTSVGAGLAPPLYCRVDLVRDDDGRPEVLEVELCEPAVFLDHAPGAVERFAAAVAGRVGASGLSG